MSNLIDEKGNEIGHPEQFDMSIYEERLKETFKHEYMGICVSDQEIIEYLEKENAELKAQINYQTHCSKTQHEAANEMSKQIAELESKVKQLRCCGNCSEPCWDFPIVRKSECLSNDYSLWEQIK